MAGNNQYVQTLTLAREKLRTEPSPTWQYLYGWASLKCHIYGCAQPHALQEAQVCLTQAYLTCPALSKLRGRSFFALMLSLILRKLDGEEDITADLLTLRLRRGTVGRKGALAAAEKECLQNIQLLHGYGSATEFRPRRCTAQDVLLYILSAHPGQLTQLSRQFKDLLVRLRDVDAAWLVLLGRSALLEFEKAAILQSLAVRCSGAILRSLIALDNDPCVEKLLKRCWLLGFSTGFPAEEYVGSRLVLMGLQNNRTKALSSQGLAFIFRHLTQEEAVIGQLSRDFVSREPVWSDTLELSRLLLAGPGYAGELPFVTSYLDYLSAHFADMDWHDAAILQRLAADGPDTQRDAAAYLLSRHMGGEAYLDAFPLRTDSQVVKMVCDRFAQSSVKNVWAALWLGSVYRVRLPLFDLLGAKGKAVRIRFCFESFRDRAMPAQHYYLQEDNYFFLPEPPEHIVLCDENRTILRCRAGQSGGWSSKQAGVDIAPAADAAAIKAMLEQAKKTIRHQDMAQLVSQGDTLGAAREVFRFLLLTGMVGDGAFNGGSEKELRAVYEILEGWRHILVDWVLLILYNRLCAAAPKGKLQDELFNSTYRVNSKLHLFPEEASGLTQEQLELSMNISEYLQSADAREGNDKTGHRLIQQALSSGVLLAAALELCCMKLESGSIYEPDYIAYASRHFDALLELPRLSDGVVTKLFARSADSHRLKLLYKLRRRTLDPEFYFALSNHCRESGRDEELVTRIVKLSCFGELPVLPTPDLAALFHRVHRENPGYEPLRQLLQSLDTGESV